MPCKPYKLVGKHDKVFETIVEAQFAMAALVQVPYSFRCADTKSQAPTHATAHANSRKKEVSRDDMQAPEKTNHELNYIRDSSRVASGSEADVTSSAIFVHGPLRLYPILYLIVLLPSLYCNLHL